MKKENIFYAVLQKTTVAGYFRDKEKAEKYALEFKEEISGYPYQIKIVEKYFLDDEI